MIRITGGNLRGRMIQCPKGKAVRPVTAFVRESLFSILGPRIVDSRVLDLFAGCGIFGIECLSRGAQRVVAVEKNNTHCAIIEQNRQKMGLSTDQYKVVAGDVYKWMAEKKPKKVGEAPFDLIFMDPPFDLEDMSPVIAPCLQNGWLAPNGLMIFEHRWEEVPLPDGVELVDRRKYSTSVVSFITASAESAPV